MLNTYLSYLQITRDLPQALARTEKQPLVDRETDYYLANIGKVKSIEEFVKNDRLFKYAMKAHGLEDMAYAKAFMIKALKEGVTSPDSFANKLTDKRYAEFVSTYNFARYGEQATTFNRAQNDVPRGFANQADLMGVQNGFRFISDETHHYLTNIENVASIDDLMADERLLTYSMAVFGLDAATEDPATVRQMLEGGVTDPNSPANLLADKRYANFVTAFNFVEHGAATTARDEVLKDVVQKYASGSGMALIKQRPEYIASEAKYFRENIASVKNELALLGNERLLTFAMAAYGLDAATETRATVKEMLDGGVTDPLSPANQSTDKRWAAFVAAFDFAQYGIDTTTRDDAMQTATDLWVAKSNAGLMVPSAGYVTAEADYYSANIGNIESIDDLMADKRMLSMAMWAYGLDASIEKPATIRQMLEGGVSAPESPANKLTDKRYANFVAAFNFVEYGERTTTLASAQRPAVDKFVRQTLEQDAGEQNEGVRLALYFERKASSVTTFYGILADPALSKVVRTVLNLPESFATADIDRQAKFFEEKFDIEDFKDPEKLTAFLKRFAASWEMANPTQTPQSQVSMLYGQPEFGISTNLLLTMQSLRR